LRALEKLRPIDELIDVLNEHGRNDWTVRALIERARNRQIKAMKITGQWVWDPCDQAEILSSLPVRQPVR
jgi:hypothetical protein